MFWWPTGWPAQTQKVHGVALQKVNGDLVDRQEMNSLVSFPADCFVDHSVIYWCPGWQGTTLLSTLHLLLYWHWGALGAWSFRVGLGKAILTPCLKSMGLASSGTLSCITAKFL